MKKYAYLWGFLGIVVLSALLTPAFFYSLPWQFKFERIYNRLVMIGTLGLVVLYVKNHGLLFKNLGFHWEPNSKRWLFFGFAMALVTLGGVLAIKVALGHVIWSPASGFDSSLVIKIISITISAFLIGFIEEFFFRGFCYQELREKYKLAVIPSILLVNVFYSLIHFVGYKKIFIDDSPGVIDGFKVAMNPLINIFHFPDYWPEALGLFLFGVVLCWLVLNSGSLYPAIGYHAGCVFFVKLDGHFVDFSTDAPLIWSSEKMYDGVLGWAGILVFGVLAAFIIRQIGPTRTKL